MRAVIADLDRTLLRTNKTLSEYTVDVMRKCRERSIAVMAATARPERAIQQYRRQICFDAVTVMNGARVILPDSVLENCISHQSGKRVLSGLVTIPDTLISVETSDGIYSNADIPEWNSNYYGGFPNLPTEGALYKILVSSTGKALCNQLEKILTNDVYYTVANGDLVQIMSKNATKWNGIRAMLKAFDISEAEAVYFGDDNDDIEPIRMCGVGVAVSNAIEAVIVEADYVAGSNDEDGAASFIEENILRERKLNQLHKKTV